MSTQSEQALENNLIAQLIEMGYERVQIADEAGLVANLRRCIDTAESWRRGWRSGLPVSPEGFVVKCVYE